MAKGYNAEVCKSLSGDFASLQLHRPMRISRYEAGQQLSYEVTSVAEAKKAQVDLSIEKFVGGGFAGQVYQVKILNIDSVDGTIDSLQTGQIYAMKILIPPTSFSKIFRNFLYWIGFGGPFQLQVNPTAARAGAIWQKFIRRAAGIRFGNENAVVDIHATFVDKNLGSCGELSEWIDGRTWRLEVDDRLDYLKLWRKGKSVDAQLVGSAEYKAKKKFMADFVKLLHDVGAHEFARQYEWSTCKSQPNCLKRAESGDNPDEGLTAVDFRAGLALLPVLPMSPGDFKLILQGLCRGSLVQFDRGSLKNLQSFIDEHRESFSDMDGMLAELKADEEIYRNSVPDITHNHLRLLYSPKLWSTMFASAVTGWSTRNFVDEKNEAKLRNNKIKTLLFYIIGVLPILGKVIRRIWAKPDWRKHYANMLSSFGYFAKALKGKVIEKVIGWHRAGRVSEHRAVVLSKSALRFACHVPFSILPAGLHRFITDWQFLKDKLHYICVRPIKLYFDKELREQWLRDMVTEGKKKHILTDEDADTILSQLKEPFIQRYLISIVVHLLTLPITQIVSVIHMGIWNWMHPDAAATERTAISFAILAAYQLIPVSPGSFCRGLYTTCLAIYDRKFKDYNIAIFLSYFKYVGYLAFPIQMTYHYPALARFMAGHWATEAVHIVPVFGERGALLEHWVFSLFYNWPLTIRRRMQKRAEKRTMLPPRFWHVPIVALAAAGLLGAADWHYLKNLGQLPGLKDIWLLAISVPLLCGAISTLAAGGMVFWKRAIAAGACGGLAAVFYCVATYLVAHGQIEITGDILAKACVWRVFVFAILGIIGALLAEIQQADPDLA